MNVYIYISNVIHIYIYIHVLFMLLYIYVPHIYIHTYKTIKMNANYRTNIAGS